MLDENTKNLPSEKTPAEEEKKDQSKEVKDSAEEIEKEGVAEESTTEATPEKAETDKITGDASGPEEDALKVSEMADEAVKEEIQVTGEQDADPPWTFNKIHIHYVLQGVELTAKAVEQAIQLSEEKYCGVTAVYKKAMEMSTEIRIID